MWAPCRVLIHGSLFAQCNLFLLCRFYAWASHHITKGCASFACTGWPVFIKNLRIIVRVMIFVTFIPVARHFNAVLPVQMVKCSVLHGNLQFSHLLIIRVYPVSHFKLFLTFCCCKPFSNFVTHFFFFIQINNIPFHWRNYRGCRSSYGSLLPLFFKCPRVCPCECGCIHEDTLFPIPPGISQLFSWNRMEQL